MPGKVTRVQATAGTVVPAGQVLVVLEAMKMEYALKADVRGLVKAIHVKVGEQVPLAKLLIELQVEAVGKDVE
jgi:biotin carboxyl carrier protein